MKLNTYAAAVAVAIASVTAIPAVAQSVSPGVVQLSRSVGVEPGTLTLAQLIALDEAQNEGGAAGRINAKAILASAGTERFSTRGEDEVNDVSRRILLERAIQEGDDFLIRQYSKPTSDTTASDRGSVTPGKAQLAASLGLNAADYTTAELVAIDTQRTFADNSK